MEPAASPPPSPLLSQPQRGGGLGWSPSDLGSAKEKRPCHPPGGFVLRLHPERAPDMLVGVGLGCLLQMTSSQLVVKVKLQGHGWHGSSWQRDPGVTPHRSPFSPAAGARQPAGLDPRWGFRTELGLLLRVGAGAVLPAGQGVWLLPHPLLPGLSLRGPADRVQGDPSLRHLTGPQHRQEMGYPSLALALPPHRIGPSPSPLPVPARGTRAPRPQTCRCHPVPEASRASPALGFWGRGGGAVCWLCFGTGKGAVTH